MDSPFYGNYRSQPARPRYSSNIRGIPVESVRQKPAAVKPAAKVVQIPVQFVGSDTERAVLRKPEPDRSGSALRIQKVFRGFLVRKCVKRIKTIKEEVEDVERKLLRRETAELICRDERERLRVNETLMSLLLKLDSVRGVDFGVRELRKAVIRKAISLQEMVDSIVSEANQIPAEEENRCNDSDELSESANQAGDITDPTGNRAEEYGKSTNQSENCDLIEQSVDVENPAAKEETDCPMGECMEGSVIEGVDDEDEAKQRRVDGEEESRRNRELLEKMVEKNEKMMRIMNELCQRNETQTRMLNSLTQRVDQLEKTFTCDRIMEMKLEWNQGKEEWPSTSYHGELTVKLQRR
ncbi:hypothetical protein BC332_16805 [Capsicum chinense]|nr:hypothetical protein BC332_16805 [Capsicum chinense]